MTIISYVTNGEAGNQSVLNRPLREALAALGLDSDDVVAPWLTEAGADALYAAIAHDHDGVYSPVGHNHDSRYYTESEVDDLVAAVGGGAVPGEHWPTKRPFISVFRGTGSALGLIGIVTTLTGSVSTPALADTSNYTRTLKLIFTGTNGAGQIIGWRSNETLMMSKLGFRLRTIFGLGADINDSMAFVGFTVSTSPLGASNPNALVNCFGVGWDQADASTGNWILFHNDASGAAIRADTGVSRDADVLLRLEIDTDDGTSYDVKIVNLETGAVVYSDTIAAELPATNAELRINVQTRNEVTAGGTVPILAHVMTTCEYGPEFL